MKRLLVGTSNPGKLSEFTTCLSDLPIKIISLTDIRLPGDAPEDAPTFSGNAEKKAVYYLRKSGIATLADDGGLEIDALSGEPGVKSHRWVDGRKENTDDELIRFTFEKMKNIPSEKRGAQLHVVVCFADISGNIYKEESVVRGIIPFKPSGKITPGFPYRSLLYIPQIGKFYDHDIMTMEETERFNHRMKAVEALKPHIKQSFGV